MEGGGARVIDGSVGGYTGMQYANDARGMRGWKNNMEVGSKGTFTAIKDIRRGQELLFAYDKSGRGGYWRRWGKKKVTKRREGQRMTSPQAPHTPNPDAGTRGLQGRETSKGARDGQEAGSARAASRPASGSDRSGGDAVNGEGTKCRRNDECDAQGSVAQGGAGRGDGRESSGGVSGKRVRAEAGEGSGMGSSGRRKGRRSAEKGGGSGTKGRGAVMYRASAAVIGSLERRMQDAGNGSQGMERSGSTWFERGEGGGVT